MPPPAGHCRQGVTDHTLILIGAELEDATQSDSLIHEPGLCHDQPQPTAPLGARTLWEGHKPKLQPIHRSQLQRVKGRTRGWRFGRCSQWRDNAPQNPGCCMGKGALRQMLETVASPREHPQLCPALLPSALCPCRRAIPESCTQHASPHSTSSWEDPGCPHQCPGQTSPKSLSIPTSNANLAPPIPTGPRS